MALEKAPQMMPDEKDRLLALFDNQNKWCQLHEARDGQGNQVPYSDEAAVAWDVVGGMCRLFGWRRACQLFGQLSRHISGTQKTRFGQDEDMIAMAALFDFNDAADTTYEKVMSMLTDMPIWRGKSALKTPSVFGEPDDADLSGPPVPTNLGPPKPSQV